MAVSYLKNLFKFRKVNIFYWITKLAPQYDSMVFNNFILFAIAACDDAWIHHTYIIHINIEIIVAVDNLDVWNKFSLLL